MLINKMKKGSLRSTLRRGLSGLAAAAMIGSSGCGDGPIGPPPVNQKPIAEATITPTQGYSPLAVDFDGSRSYDPDGTVRKYVWNFGDGSVDSTSGAIARHMYETNGNYNTGLTVVDDKEARNSKSLVMIAVTQAPQPEPVFSQSTDVPSDSLKVTYNATAMENLDSAKVGVQRDGALVDSMTIKKSQIPFTKTYDIPGIYKFISDIPGLKPDTTTGTVKDYAAAPNFSVIPDSTKSVNEGDSISIDLESAVKNSDLNLCDRPVRLDSAYSTDGKTLVSTSGDTLNVNALGDNIGVYNVNLILSNARGVKDTVAFDGQIYDLARLRGRIENSETDVGTQATIIPYEIVGGDTLRLQTSTSDDSLRNVTDINGNFDFKI